MAITELTGKSILSPQSYLIIPSMLADHQRQTGYLESLRSPRIGQLNKTLHKLTPRVPSRLGIDFPRLVWQNR